jgi:hypothetical protein
LKGKEKALGLDHTLTLDTVNNLGILYWNQGKLKEAEEMYQRALKGYEEALKHPITLLHCKCRLNQLSSHLIKATVALRA